jgi:DNA-nicking Smr family endonuclease
MNEESDETSELFRRAMAGVRQRPACDRLPPPRPRLRAQPLSQQADERAVLTELLHGSALPETLESGEALSYRAPGLQDAVWRRLRRGSYRIAAELDLHGLNRLQAQQAVHRFLADCQARGRRSVRIIHGKGRGSPNGSPVIKTLLDAWLRRRRDVLAFCSAQPHDGGTGAVYVLLKASQNFPPAR